jgi:hypothetical protein
MFTYTTTTTTPVKQPEPTVEEHQQAATNIALMVAAYYTALRNNGVPADLAETLTCGYQASLIGWDDEDDDD